MGCHYPQPGALNSASGEPNQCAGVRDHWHFSSLPEFGGQVLQSTGSLRRRQPGADEDGIVLAGQYRILLKRVDHHRLKLSGDR